MRQFLANIRPGFPSIPAAPTIGTVIDNGDEDSITVPVVGIGTIQLYYRIKYVSNWTTGLTRSGTGNIVQTGLTAGKWYELYVTDTIDGMASPPSKTAIIKTVDTDDDTTIETALFSILIADDTVGLSVTNRIYPNIVPQKAAMPAITYQQISGPRQHVMTDDSGLVQASYQINCWSKTYVGARELSEAVRKVLDGYNGTVNTRVIHAILLDDEGDMPQMQAESDVLLRYGKRLDFTIWYIEATT
jgi:hypothetical protein